jgi:pimeloyl-ACP methyl ester carboxylesterase
MPLAPPRQVIHTSSMKPELIRNIIIIIGAIILLIGLVVTIIYALPLTSGRLQTSSPASMSYKQAVAKVAAINENETPAKTESGCQSALLTHGDKTAKSVVMFHGLTACPKQFKELAQVFYDAGYNVYVPRAPYHGSPSKQQHGQVVASDLVDYANTSVTIATGLGEQVGVVGLSGGGMISTWASEYRPEVTRALLMAPFYEPAPQRAPKWQLQFLNVLYGYHILPDRFVDDEGTLFSYRALANYDILTKNLKKDPSGSKLTNLGLITTPHDTQIDPELALSIPRGIAEANKQTTYIETSLPSDWNVEHDMVTPTNKPVAERKAQLYKLFLDTYEGRTTQL